MATRSVAVKRPKPARFSFSPSRSISICSSKSCIGSRQRRGDRTLLWIAQREPAGIEVAALRQLRPIHHAGEKGHIAVVNLAGQRVLGGCVGEDLFAELAERLDQLVAEPPDLDPLVGAQNFEPL